MRRFLSFCIVLGGGILAFALIALLIWGPPRDLRGTWQTDGYGRVIDVGRFTIDSYQLSDVHCLRDLRVVAHMPLIRRLTGSGFAVRDGVMSLTLADATAPITARKVAGVPSLCSGTGQTDDAASYAVFWQVMAEHYPFFDLYGVDWNARKTMTDPDLWTAITTAMAGLDDGHLYISDGTRAQSPETPPAWFADRHLVRDTTLGLIPQALTRVPDTGLATSLLADNIGYLYVSHLDSNPRIGTAPADFARFAISQIATGFADTDGLIIDLRYAPGGSDAVALAYAGAFTDTPTQAYAKVTRTTTGTTAPVKGTVSPVPPTVSQPVVVLTSGFTAAAAEVLTLALHDMPQVTVIGEHTAGNLSDILKFTLPNGWELGLSHQIYRDSNGQTVAGTGISPDIALPVDVAAFRAGLDPALMQAITLLSQSRRP